jgi:D-beta-D-heptose 7-phosphate kinase / D-beta-D-heptose 1-phosphate adenosyltransferase
VKPLVVVGDSLLDVDLVGRAGRLSPDAPVPVLDDLVELARPGGAGLAALLAARSGTEVVLLTAWSDDEAGELMTSLLEPAVSLCRVPGGSTPVKRRVRAGGQSLVRLDSGSTPVPLGELDDGALAALDAAGAVLVSDYGRGISAHAQLRRRLGDLGRVPLVWDPHPAGAQAVAGARLLTPNTAELDGLTGGAATRGVMADRAVRAADLGSAWAADAVAVTLGEQGALLVSPGGGVPSYFPAPRVAARDTCGAGDRFAATALVRLAQGALTSEAVEEAVASAAHFVADGAAGSLGRSTGASTQAGAERADRSPVVVATGGCFDLLHAGHVACLQAARKLGDRLVVCLNSDASVRRLKGPERPVVPQEDRARVLEALSCVDEVVVFDEDTPVEVLRRLRPDIWAKGGDYDRDSLPETAVLAEWGGQAVVLPYLSGRSTSDLVRTVRTREGSSR